jgi:hypothetical protein
MARDPGTALGREMTPDGALELKVHLAKTFRGLLLSLSACFLLFFALEAIASVIGRGDAPTLVIALLVSPALGAVRVYRFDAKRRAIAISLRRVLFRRLWTRPGDDAEIPFDQLRSWTFVRIPNSYASLLTLELHDGRKRELRVAGTYTNRNLKEELEQLLGKPVVPTRDVQALSATA